MRSENFFDQIINQVGEGQRYWLFLDYDGTLAEFVSSPEDVLPDEELIALLKQLSAHPDRLRPVLLSGRRLGHIRRLAPVAGMMLAGNYGIEFRGLDGEEVLALDLEAVRPVIEQVKSAWEALLDGHRGFFLEDKGYSLALHARDAAESDLPAVIPAAQSSAERIVGSAPLRVLSVPRFVEVAPAAARKSLSVKAFVERMPWPGARVLYFGDDDRDEEAFGVARALGGDGVLVAREPRPTQASARLDSPAQVRDFLARLAAALENPPAAA